MINVKRNHLQSGFSFLEMMVVLVIIGIILGFVGPRMVSLLGRGRATATKNTLKVVGEAVQAYKYDVGKYPDTLDELNNPPEGVRGYQGPYLDDRLAGDGMRDGWNEMITYEKKEKGSKPPFELYSEGDPDKEDDRIDYKG